MSAGHGVCMSCVMTMLRTGNSAMFWTRSTDSGETATLFYSSILIQIAGALCWPHDQAFASCPGFARGNSPCQSAVWMTPAHSPIQVSENATQSTGQARPGQARSEEVLFCKNGQLDTQPATVRAKASAVEQQQHMLPSMKAQLGIS